MRLFSRQAGEEPMRTKAVILLLLTIALAACASAPAGPSRPGEALGHPEGGNGGDGM